MAGLLSDPARQAQDTIRGYIYQILRSILVWLDLGDDELLFLEGAEDLDRIKGTEALTEQVKDTAGSGNITLRTASVVDAINNFWTHQTRNPGIAIRYRVNRRPIMTLDKRPKLTPSFLGLQTIAVGAGMGVRRRRA